MSSVPLVAGWQRWLLVFAASAASLFFRAELWPHTPLAAFFSVVGLALAGMLLAVQLARALGRWYANYRGPYWGQVLLGMFVGGGLVALVGGAALAFISLVLLLLDLVLGGGRLEGFGVW